MDIKERLENYITLNNKKYRLMAEISRLEKTRNEYTPSILNSGVGSLCRGSVTSPTENAAINSLMFFERINADIIAKSQELALVLDELKILDEYIDAIPDEKLKEVFILKYKQDVSWANIAIQWYYSPSSWMHLKKKVLNYINQHNLQ